MEVLLSCPFPYDIVLKNKISRLFVEYFIAFH
jgi:hypothetical protein